MKIPLYQVDAFTSKIFNGNPAAVCPLEDWIDDDIMQKIAQENNLSETAFFVKNKSEFEILKTIDYDKYNIKVISVENNLPMEQSFKEFFLNKNFSYFDRVGADEIFYNNIHYKF